MIVRMSYIIYINNIFLLMVPVRELDKRPIIDLWFVQIRDTVCPNKGLI